MKNMKRLAGLFCATLTAAAAGCATMQYSSTWSGVDRAVCVVSATPGNSVAGVVNFEDTDEGLLVTAEITGLTPSQAHGFHVHQHGFSGSGDATCTGGHYDPEGTGFHGLPGFEEAHHAGDLGGLQADRNGNATYRGVFENLSVAGKNAVVGRAIIVHAKPDDGGQPTGNAGARIGVGNIGIAGH